MWPQFGHILMQNRKRLMYAYLYKARLSLIERLLAVLELNRRIRKGERI